MEVHSPPVSHKSMLRLPLLSKGGEQAGSSRWAAESYFWPVTSSKRDTACSTGVERRRESQVVSPTFPFLPLQRTLRSLELSRSSLCWKVSQYMRITISTSPYRHTLHQLGSAATFSSCIHSATLQGYIVTPTPLVAPFFAPRDSHRETSTCIRLAAYSSSVPSSSSSLSFYPPAPRGGTSCALSQTSHISQWTCG